MKIIFHIGMPKTGTTSLQNYMLTNKKYLMSKGFIYEPEVFSNPQKTWGVYDHNYFIRSIVNNPNESISKLLYRLKLYADKFNYYIISSEAAINSLTEKYIKFLYDNLKGYDIEIVLYIRRQDDLIESFYKTCVKCGMCFSIDEALKICNPYYDAIVDRWQQNKNIKIHVVKYEANKTILKFFDIYGVKINNYNAYNDNISVSTNHVELLYLITKNTDIKFYFLEPALQLFMQGLQVPRSYRIFSLDERKAIMKKYEDSNIAISKKFFDGKPLFEPLPTTDTNYVGYPALNSDEIIKILERYIFYCVKSSKYVDDLIKYISESGEFDENFYRDKYLCGRVEKYKPIEHFVLSGMYRNFMPNKCFDMNEIYQLYPELKSTGIPPYILYTVLKIIGKIK